METFVKVADDFDSGDVAIISHGRATGGYPTLGKTPVWAIAHGLERVLSLKKYRLENCMLKELGEAANDAYFIEGILNTKIHLVKCQNITSTFHVDWTEDDGLGFIG